MSFLPNTAATYAGVAVTIAATYKSVVLAVPTEIPPSAVDNVLHQIPLAGVLSIAITGAIPATLDVFLSADGVPITDAQTLTVIDETNGKGCAILLGGRVALTGVVRCHFQGSAASGSVSAVKLALGQ